MWEDLTGMGISFVDGVMPPYTDKKKAQPAPAEAPATTAAPAASPAEPTAAAPEPTAAAASPEAPPAPSAFEASEAPEFPPADSSAAAVTDAVKPEDLAEVMEPVQPLANGHRKSSMKRPEVRPADPYYVHHVAL